MYSFRHYTGTYRSGCSCRGLRVHVQINQDILLENSDCVQDSRELQVCGLDLLLLWGTPLCVLCSLCGLCASLWVQCLANVQFQTIYGNLPELVLLSEPAGSSEVIRTHGHQCSSEKSKQSLCRDLRKSPWTIKRGNVTIFKRKLS
jgi:hypothetical protein